MSDTFEGIRFFATNRDMENLRQRRKDRVQLWSGGYFFIDMEKYVAHYLDKVETSTLPDDCIIEDSNQTVFEKYINHDSVGSVVICVHGFNVHLHEAYFWYRTLTDTLRHTDGLRDVFVFDPSDLPKQTDPAQKGKRVAFIGFSWPSNGSVFSYANDQREAIASAPALANLIARIHVWGKRVNLVCHSMGNHLACHMLAGLVNKTIFPKNIIEAALDKTTRTAAARDTTNTSVTDESDLLKLVSRRDPVGAAATEPTGATPTGRTAMVLRGNDGKLVHFVDRYVMLAPDIERRQVTRTKIDAKKATAARNEEEIYVGIFHGGIEHLVGRTFNFYSRFDGALAISNLEKAPRKALASAKSMLDKVTFGLIDYLERNPDEKWEQRLGASPHPPNAPPNMTSFNATEISDREIGHSDYIDSRPLAYLVGMILAGQLDNDELAKWNAHLRKLLARDS